MPGSGTTVLVLANPVSGRGRGRAAAERLADLLTQAGDEVRLVFTGKAGDARTVAAGLEPDVDRLAVVGGDGTMNEVVSGLARFDVPVALLPTGTANLLGTELGLVERPEDTAALLHHGSVRRLDLGRLPDRRFVSVVGVGFDAEVAAGVARRRHGPITKLAYIVPTVDTLCRYDPPRLTVCVDGETVAEDAAWVLVCNIRRYAAFFQFTPEADPTDGRFDVFVLHDRGRLGLTSAYLKALLGRPSRAGAASYPRGTAIQISSPSGPVPFEVDGDLAGQTPVEMNLEPGALPLLTP